MKQINGLANRPQVFILFKYHSMFWLLMKLNVEKKTFFFLFFLISFPDPLVF